MSELDPAAQIGKNAPCPLLYQQTRGTVGYCTRCLDCYTCPTMQLELSRHPLDAQIWVCSVCVGHLARAAKQQRIGNVLMGFYTEGLCAYPGCGRYSILLQLVLGPIVTLLEGQ